MTSASWPTEWTRGVLSYAVLGTMAAGPTYGYAISRALAAGGLGVVKGGTLYPMLARLEKDGLVTAHWEQGSNGPGRKYFELTDRGADYLKEMSTTWEHFSGTIKGFLSGTVTA